MGRITTHILDTANGAPAADVDVRLYAIGSTRELVVAATSNADGRTDAPLLAGDEMKTGTYELEFDIGPYFSRYAIDRGDPAFLDTVVIRFAVAANENYHVPLLASPWSYSTYRGS